MVGGVETSPNGFKGPANGNECEARERRRCLVEIGFSSLPRTHVGRQSVSLYYRRKNTPPTIYAAREGQYSANIGARWLSRVTRWAEQQRFMAIKSSPTRDETGNSLSFTIIITNGTSASSLPTAATDDACMNAPFRWRRKRQ